MARSCFVLGLVLVGVWACGGEARETVEDEGGETAEDIMVPPEVEITAPMAGDTVAGGTVTIRLAVYGVELRPAGTQEPNTGHHHLFVDRDITAVGDTIPAEAGIVHLGAAQTEHELPLGPGAHTIIAVLGDHAHVRMAEVKTDTVSVVVR